MPHKQHPPVPKGSKYLYATIKDHKVKVTSKKQHRYLHWRKLPHDHAYRTRTGRIVYERINA